MREERGQLSGDVTVDEPFNLWGSIAGNVSVVKGAKFYVRGAIHGNLTVEEGGRCHIYGQVIGDLYVMEGAKVIHSGMLRGNAINNGGRLYVDKHARVIGRVTTNQGDTFIQPQDEATQ